MANSHNPTADCIFCKIIAGELTSQTIAETDRVIAFRDINPQAPLHALIVPKRHYGDVAQVAGADPELLAEMVSLADEVASEHADGQFRFIFNSGPNAGQSVFHVHGHVLGGTKLGWNPA
ncbi:histidine triad nucleotide-binding protein [Populibacterium corticicola]|jgi:histidine triad (HIT) family protein|uniref:Histidine triad nucleotide-binding protein n=1 Tax=Populibacterium corticicola TaxID=1812826 RepID=A0ABW5XBQ8_9MICO